MVNAALQPKNSVILSMVTFTRKHRCVHRLATSAASPVQSISQFLKCICFFLFVQVSCLNDICGMFPFISPDIPDQFYRLFTSLCLHAGLIHLAITIAFQHIFMADLERLLGPIRTAILYIGSGVAGNLTSSIFLPYKPEVTIAISLDIRVRFWFI